jgi:metal-responsive CopG/Arc/MetJ family transcriptional regulator
MSSEMKAEIDGMRDLVSRSAFIVMLIELGLEEYDNREREV